MANLISSKILKISNKLIEKNNHDFIFSHGTLQ